MRYEVALCSNGCAYENQLQNHLRALEHQPRMSTKASEHLCFIHSRWKRKSHPKQFCWRTVFGYTDKYHSCKAALLVQTKSQIKLYEEEK